MADETSKTVQVLLRVTVNVPLEQSGSDGGEVAQVKDAFERLILDATLADAIEEGIYGSDDEDLTVLKIGIAGVVLAPAPEGT